MVLIRKVITGGYFEFDKILRSGYKIKEDYDRTTTKYVNGNRRQFLSEYEDVEIELNLAPIDKTTLKTYLDNLTNGTYEYYSLKHAEYRTINMIIEKIPELVVENAINNDADIEEFKVKLLKSSNVVVSL